MDNEKGNYINEPVKAGHGLLPTDERETMKFRYVFLITLAVFGTLMMAMVQFAGANFNKAFVISGFIVITAAIVTVLVLEMQKRKAGNSNTE